MTRKTYRKEPKGHFDSNSFLTVGNPDDTQNFLSHNHNSLKTTTAAIAAENNSFYERKQCLCTYVWYFDTLLCCSLQNNYLEERNLCASEVTFAGYLLELQEHANLIAAVQMQKVRPKKKTFSLDRIEKRFRQVTKYISSRKV